MAARGKLEAAIGGNKERSHGRLVARATKKHHRDHRATYLRCFSFIAVLGLVSLFVPHSIYNYRGDNRGSMINYTNIVATALHMPKVGLGTLGISPSEARPVINEALSLGYRLIDCAPVYFNEREIGDAFHESPSGVPRTDVFVTSKLACPFHRPEHVEPALRKTLNDLRLGYLDLFLIHWPVAFKYVDFDPAARGWENEGWFFMLELLLSCAIRCVVIDFSFGNALRTSQTLTIQTEAKTLTHQYRSVIHGPVRFVPSSLVGSVTSVCKPKDYPITSAMEALVDKGLVKHIGVANFPVMLLHDLLSYSRIPPAVNQIEVHPYNQQSKLLAFCKSRDIAVQAYSPLGTPGYRESGEPDLLSDPVLEEMANSRGTSVAQLCLQWSIQRGCHVVAKSSNKKHMEENMIVNHKNGFAVSNEAQLSDEEMKRIASLDRGYRYFRPEDWWKDMPVFD